jgi:hypothetical protein
LNNVADWLNPANNGSQVFELQNIQILADSYTIDEAVQNSFMSAMLRNRVLSLPVYTVYSMVQNIPSGATSYTFSSVRAFSRLAQIWIHFRKDGPLSSSFICPGNLPGEAVDDEIKELKNTAVPQRRVSIGPKNWQDPQPLSTAAEYYYNLTKALGHQPNVTRHDFEHNTFAMVFDVKRNPHDPTSALSTRSGEMIHVQLTNLTVNAATEVHLSLVAFGVVGIRESGITLLT